MEVNIGEIDVHHQPLPPLVFRPVACLFNCLYWHPEVCAALDVLTKAADKKGIPLAQATNRWMRHCSSLTAKDGILVGVSSLRQPE
ncbi:hypothetical protein CPB97_003202 [Podila verticillata]|nr:hypothetical protein CPB97_003202 [Podila verticillata]